MNFYGSTPLNVIMETLDFAVYEHDIAMICLDNLQFMLSNQAEGVRKFDL